MLCLHYITNYYDGYKSSKVATHWRIHTGINKGDTASTVETNLALALQNYDGVKMLISKLFGAKDIQQLNVRKTVLTTLLNGPTTV
jgi:hypothetical protein